MIQLVEHVPQELPLMQHVACELLYGFELHPDVFLCQQLHQLIHQVLLFLWLLFQNGP